MSISVVIDANLVVYSALKTPQSPAASKVMEYTARKGYQLSAPGLWWYEVTSVIHRYLFHRLVSEKTAYAALELLTVELGFQKIEVTERNAFDWATRLRQKAAYDGFYLAAAQQLGADLWTADQGLANNARQAGVNWVHWMNEIDSLEEG